MSVRGRIKKIITGYKFPHVYNYLKEFEGTDWYSENQIKEYQNKKLRELIDFAYHHVPYYHRIFTELGILPQEIQTAEDLSRLPILTKEIIWREGENMYADVSLDKVKESSTSGSTGKSLVFRKTQKARIIERALMMRYRQNGGISEDSYSMSVWGAHSVASKVAIKNAFVSWLMNECTYSTYDLSKQNVHKIIEILQSGRIDYLRGYTSAIFYIAQEMNRRNIHITVPFISVTAEQLYDFQRKEIELALGKNLFNQYGCGECGALAMECSSHEGLHHVFEHSILEVLDDGNKPVKHGRVILTNLDNYAMPLIRYENGDMLTLAERKCTCGRHSQLIAHIDGRQYDILEGEEGHFAHAGFFDDCILKIDLMNKYKIRQMRIVQKQQTIFKLQYVADMKIGSDDEAKLNEEYRMILGDSVQLIFEKKEKLSSASSGKRHFIVPLRKYIQNPSLYE